MMQFIDRILYRLGIVRRSHFDGLREASISMIDEYNRYKNNIYNWQCESLNQHQEQSMPKPPKFKIIQGGKNT